MTDLTSRKADVERIDWYHELDFGDGLRTRPRAPNVAGCRSAWQLIEQQLGRVDFRDKTVVLLEGEIGLDIYDERFRPSP